MNLPHLPSMARAALLVNLLPLAACLAPPELPGANTGASGLEGVPPQLAGPFAPTGASRPTLRSLPAAQRHGRPPQKGLEEETVMDQLSSPVTDAVLVDGLGDRIAAKLDEAEASRRPVREYGVAALTQAELFGDGLHEGVCELPQVRYNTTHNGQDWEITLGMALWENFVGDLNVGYASLTPGCANALAANGGNADAAMDDGDCVDLEIETILPEGSECRACIEGNGGDLLTCQETEACPIEAPEVVAVGSEYWNRAEVELLACAPDYTVTAAVLGDFGSDGSLPTPFDVEGWGYICAPFYSPDSRSVEYACQGGNVYEPMADTLRVGVHGLVEGMRRNAGDSPSWSHRNFYTPRITLEDGSEIRSAWEAYLSLGMMVQEPAFADDNGDGQFDPRDEDFGYGYTGWGLNPMHLRPDGSDPNKLDDTKARDWWGGIAMKTATTMTGVPITMANRSRCADGAWEDPDGDGSFRCTKMDPPVGGYLNDGANFWWIAHGTATLAFPIATLASTGLPDADIPGGIVPWVAGSPTLADPDFDGCSWGHSFTPDRAVYPDVPADYDGPASFWGDAYRFGAHEDDIRILLYVNIKRDYCPSGEVIP
ncbi:MAG TPA: hypothetical protein PKW90_04700 [Myxococcota bacterium]|nr:hypothetical protein [Myxococcota bacterium]